MRTIRRNEEWFDSLDEALANAQPASHRGSAVVAPARGQLPYAELAAVGVVVLGGCLLLQLAR